MPVSTIEPSPGLDPRRPADERRLATAMWLRRAWLALLAVFVLAGTSGLLGLRTRTVSAGAGDYRLDVYFAQTSRAALPTPFDITVVKAGGFDGEPVTIAVDAGYLALFDENGLDPEPSATTADDELVLWEFDPPPGEVLHISFDARIEPGVWGRHEGEVHIVEDGDPAVSARFTTWLIP